MFMLRLKIITTNPQINKIQANNLNFLSFGSVLCLNRLKTAHDNRAVSVSSDGKRKELENSQNRLGKMKLIVVDPVAPTNPNTVSNELTNIAMTKVENKMTELSIMNLPSGISSST